MTSLRYVKPETMQLKNHAEFTEAWLRDRIVEDPTILGLGEVQVKDVERNQPGAGRLDLLLKDSETDSRYEVELMLGTVNESHIIRCIEYWDIERKRYPAYDHYAVLIAENITSRFLNVISLFNNAIPIIAIQLNALKIGDNIALNFVKVLDVIEPGEDDDEDSEGPPTDRTYWEQRASKSSMEILDTSLALLRELEPGITLNYKKFFVGLAHNGRSNNFVTFHPRKQFVVVGAVVKDRNFWTQKFEHSGLTVMPARKFTRRVRFRLTKEDLVTQTHLLREILKACYVEQQ